MTSIVKNLNKRTKEAKENISQNEKIQIFNIFQMKTGKGKFIYLLTKYRKRVRFDTQISRKSNHQFFLSKI